MRVLCPDENVNTWQKIEPYTILASCDNVKKDIYESITNKISSCDHCRIIIIHDFAKEDAGVYVCFTNKTKMGTFIKHQVEVRPRSKYLSHGDYNSVKFKVNNSRFMLNFGKLN